MHPKYSTNVVTMTADELVLWRRGNAGYRRQQIEGLQTSKEVRDTKP